MAEFNTNDIEKAFDELMALAGIDTLAKRREASIASTPEKQIDLGKLSQAVNSTTENLQAFNRAVAPSGATASYAYRNRRTANVYASKSELDIAGKAFSSIGSSNPSADAANAIRQYKGSAALDRIRKQNTLDSTIKAEAKARSQGGGGGVSDELFYGGLSVKQAAKDKQTAARIAAERKATETRRKSEIRQRLVMGTVGTQPLPGPSLLKEDIKLNSGDIREFYQQQEKDLNAPELAKKAIRDKKLATHAANLDTENRNYIDSKKKELAILRQTRNETTRSIEKSRAGATVLKTTGQAMQSFGWSLTKYVTAPLLLAAKMGIQFNSTIESANVSMRTLLGSTERGNKLTNDLVSMALKSPLTVQGAVGAAQTGLAFGMDESMIRPMVQQIGDISLGDTSKFERLTLAFAQTQAAGKLMGQDLLQMVNAGFNPLLIISEKTGMSLSQLRKEMENGNISAKAVAKAFEIASAEGGRFYNGMSNASKTFKGQLTLLGEAVQVVFGKMTEKTFNKLTTQILPALRDKVEALGKMYETHPKLIEDIVTKLALLGPGLIVAGTGLKALGGFISTIATATAFLKVGTLNTQISTLTSGLSNAIEMLKNGTFVAPTTVAKNAAAQLGINTAGAATGTVGANAAIKAAGTGGATGAVGTAAAKAAAKLAAKETAKAAVTKIAPGAIAPKTVLTAGALIPPALFTAVMGLANKLQADNVSDAFGKKTGTAHFLLNMIPGMQAFTSGVHAAASIKTTMVDPLTNKTSSLKEEFEIREKIAEVTRLTGESEDAKKQISSYLQLRTAGASTVAEFDQLKSLEQDLITLYPTATSLITSKTTSVDELRTALEKLATATLEASQAELKSSARANYDKAVSELQTLQKNKPLGYNLFGNKEYDNSVKAARDAAQAAYNAYQDTLSEKERKQGPKPNYSNNYSYQGNKDAYEAEVKAQLDAENAARAKADDERVRNELLAAEEAEQAKNDLESKYGSPTQRTDIFNDLQREIRNTAKELTSVETMFKRVERAGTGSFSTLLRNMRKNSMQLDSWKSELDKLRSRVGPGNEAFMQGVTDMGPSYLRSVQAMTKADNSKLSELMSYYNNIQTQADKIATSKVIYEHTGGFDVTVSGLTESGMRIVIDKIFMEMNKGVMSGNSASIDTGMGIQ